MSRPVFYNNYKAEEINLIKMYDICGRIENDEYI